MLNFRMADDSVATTTTRSSTAYKVIPERSTAAVASGLDRLFATTPSETPSREHERSSSGISNEEANTAKQQRMARESDNVHRELDEYLREPLESFRRVEKAGDTVKTIIFDVLGYWQVC